MDYSMLLSPMKIGNLEIKNRTVMTAAEFSMGQANGKPTEKLMDYYEERAKGGVGLIIPGICRVNDMYATSSFTQLAMSHDYHIEPMREFVGENPQARRETRHPAAPPRPSGLCQQREFPSDDPAAGGEKAGNYGDALQGDAYDDGAGGEGNLPAGRRPVRL